MKKILRTTLAFFLAFVMIFGSAPLADFLALDSTPPDWLNFDWLKVEASAYTQGIYTYEVANGEATVTYCDEWASGDIIIPPELGGYSVTGIGASSFSFCTGLTSIIITDSVTSIGEYAFYNCTNLTSVTIPDSVTSIGEYAFVKCADLTAITVGTGNTAYTSLNGVLFNKTKTILIHYPGGKEGAYSIPNSVTSIGNSSFSSCFGLTSVTIPDSVTSIGEDAFHNCTNLTSITIPDSVTSIGNGAFYMCYGLSNVIIPDSVTSIEYGAFGNTAWNDNQPPGLVYAGKVAYSFKGDMPENTSITLESDTKGIAGGAFENCTGLTSITIPDSVKRIGQNAFFNCTGLTSVTFPDSVTSIGDSSFSFCSGLTSVTFPDSVTCIGDKTFSSCIGLTSITIPDSVTSIGFGLFSGCTALADITVGAGNNSYTSLDGVLFNKPKTILIQYPGGKEGAYSVPSSVKSIGELAFCECTCLTSITLPNNLASIGFSAFEDCTGLTSITIPESVTSIEYFVFSGCSGLTSVMIGKSVTSIGLMAFLNCTGLTSVIIPDSVTSIGYWAFASCSGLMSVMIGKSVTSIEIGAFANCTALTSVIIPDTVTSIEEDVFYGCDDLTIFGVPDSYAETYADDNSIPFVPVYLFSASSFACVVDTFSNLIYGLEPSMTLQQFENDAVQVAVGYSLLYSSETFGTGTQVKVKKDDNGTVVAVFTIIIFGDTNGDGNIDSIDAGTMVDYENYMFSWDPTVDAAYLKAGDLNGDGNVDSIDAGIAVDAENYLLTIDQTTGLAL